MILFSSLEGTGVAEPDLALLFELELELAAEVDPLDLEPDLIPPILSEEEVEALVRVYLENMRSNYDMWMGNTIRQEAEDWSGEAEPELDVENCFYTSTPVLVNRYKGRVACGVSYCI